MSSEIEKANNLPEEQPEQFQNLDLPKHKVQEIFQELEIMAMQKGRPSLDVSKFNEAQIDKVIDVLKQNEDNAFKYHSKRIDAAMTIKLAEITAGTTNQRTLRIVLLVMAVIVLLMSVLILLLKQEFFAQWLTFVSALLGGVGLTKLFSPTITKKSKSDSTEDELEDKN